MKKGNIKTLRSSKDYIRKSHTANTKLIKNYKRNIHSYTLKAVPVKKITSSNRKGILKLNTAREVNLNTLSYKANRESDKEQPSLKKSKTSESFFSKSNSQQATNSQVRFKLNRGHNLQRIKVKNSEKVINFTDIQKSNLIKYKKFRESGAFTEIRKPTDRIKKNYAYKGLKEKNPKTLHSNNVKSKRFNSNTKNLAISNTNVENRHNISSSHQRPTPSTLHYNDNIESPTSYSRSLKENNTRENGIHKNNNNVNKANISNNTLRLFEKHKTEPPELENQKISTSSNPKDRIKTRNTHNHSSVNNKGSQSSAKRGIQKNMLKEYIYHKSRNNEDDNTNYGVHSYKKAFHDTYKVKKNAKKVANTYSNVKTATVKTVNTLVKVIKAIATFVSKIASLKGLLIALIAIIPVILLLSLITGFQSILPAQFVMCDDATRAIVKQISDDEGTYQGEKYHNEVASARESYDEVYEYIYGDGFDVDYRYVLCLLAVMTNQNIDESALEKIPQIHSMFYEIDVETKEREEIKSSRVENPETGEVTYEEETVTITIITFKIKSFSVLEVADNLGFNDIEIDWLNALLSNELTYEYGYNPSVPLLSEAEINELLNNVQSEDERNIVKTALSLLGITRYEWGGKAEAGGTPKGLDCSGFVSWVYKTSLGYYGLDGGGTAYQFGVTDSVNNSELKIGDLGFWKYPSETAGTPSNANHVGIYIGKDENGNNLFIHSQGGTGVCISAFPFKHFKRVNY